MPPAADLVVSITSLRIESRSRVDGLVTLGTPAPAGGAAVALTSNNPDVVKVPATVTVPEGVTSAPFTIETSTIFTATDYTLTARYRDFNNVLTFTLRPPHIEALFSVSSQRRGNNVCQVIDGPDTAGNSLDDPRVDCRLDARASTGPISRYLWAFEIGASSWEQDSRDPQMGIEVFGCDLIENERPITDANGEKYLRLTISLTLLDPDRQFADDEEKIIRLYLGSSCGF